ncbi:S53 family peptidase [Streptomyces acidiscabies]|uniref:S53 family peptidase n=1 Tax=Streptomyces acidiscabies TaxID=42234 RepID=A0AAP6BIX0_9ACTN|nr:S53 family peptidase [Streptomyces acidiscabies]MBP5940051.1 S8/S53 family peptidase [Streptomyces sp. LBUM 1476]MBZ3911249.1 S8/S53 family peptidase [Streptomyces acidiscabies]MDX2965551.1 S53 family peptidase [Streptomyces acidiscabies]MDX3025129.1 S53 family peptidase [Streptomyces acidiscabies]MDX3795505.1 S53 family peptidase [Streptomyces acidiscabies]
MRSNRAALRAGVSLAAALPMVAGALALGIPTAQAADTPARDTLAGTKPAWATAQADKGSTADSAQVNARVYLAGRDAQGLSALAKAVSDPNSASYGSYLSAPQAQARFGATKAQVAAVQAWLTKAGLKVTGTNQHYVSVSGDVTSAERAFGTQMHNYTKDGHTYRAPAKAASVPASLNGAVLTVTGLDNAPHHAKAQDQLPAPGKVFANSGPFSSYYGSNIAKTLPDAYGTKIPYAVQGYTGKQLRAAYGAGKYTGKGVRVAITDAYASPTIAFDAQTYAKAHGDAKWKTGQLTQVLPKTYTNTEDCDASGWYGEETLDVEAVHAVAPDAQVTYVGGASCSDPDLLDALNKVVDNHLADIVSNSWADLEGVQTPDSAAAYDQTFQFGAVEGIGFYFSSGDDGDEVLSSGKKQVETPANSAWVTAVGGTSLAVGKGDKYLWETGWGTQKALLAADGKSWTSFPGAFTSGGGGGTSKTVPEPFYQKGIVPDTLAKANSAAGNRVLPDIAAIADPNTGFKVGQTQTFPDGSQQYGEYRIGGTSLAAPVIAAVQALAQQARGGKAIGFANPQIYAKAGTKVYHDVTDNPTGKGLAVARLDFVNGFDATGGVTTSVRSLGKDSSLSAVKGYDDVTGVGSPAKGYVESYKKK